MVAECRLDNVETKHGSTLEIDTVQSHEMWFDHLVTEGIEQMVFESAISPDNQPEGLLQIHCLQANESGANGLR